MKTDTKWDDGYKWKIQEVYWWGNKRPNLTGCWESEIVSPGSWGRVNSDWPKGVRPLRLPGDQALNPGCPTKGTELCTRRLLEEWVQFSSVTQSCPTLCNPMNRSKPGLPNHHQLPEFTQTHVRPVHQVSLQKCPLPPPCGRAEIGHWRE